MLDRRTFLQTAAALGAAAWTQDILANETAKEKPNLLWLSCEDISPHLGCYGCPDAITPALDAFAAKGVRFDNAFAAAPVCAPNRSTIITGVYAAALGSHHMRSGGEGPKQSSKPELPEQVVPFPILLRETGYYCTNNSKEDYNFKTSRTIWDESGNKAHWRNRSDPNQPFFAVFNYTGTHESQVRATPEGIARLTRSLQDDQRRDPARVALPPYHADTPDTRRNWANYHELITALDYWVADLLAQLKEDGLAENTIVFFWSDHGHGLPRGKRWLYDSGVRIPLIVHVPEKWQAWARLEPGRADDRLVSCVDFAPTMLNLAGLPLPAFLQGQPFLGPDQPAPRQYVYATRDRMDERYDMIRMVRDKRYKYIRNYRPDLPYNQYLDYAEQSPVKQDLNRLAAENHLPAGAAWVAATTKPVEEVYEVEADPHELHNLADVPEMADTVQRLREVHLRWMDEIHDLGLIPEPELARLADAHGARYSIYETMTASHPDFWIAIRRTADAAAAMTAADKEYLREALKDPHPSIRYWAVIGLRRDVEQDGVLRDALRDDAPLVAVAAAHGLLSREGGDPEAMAVLLEALEGSDEWVRLMAAHALDDAGENAREALPLLRNALEDPENKYVARVAEHLLSRVS